MIELHTPNTPAARSITILLEEAEHDYAVNVVTTDGEGNLPPQFLNISPDPEHRLSSGLAAHGETTTIVGYGPILRRLVENSPRVLPQTEPERAAALQCLDWCITSLEPALRQFQLAGAGATTTQETAIGPEAELAVQQFNELENRLSATAHLAGEQFSVADIAAYPHTRDVRAALARVSNCEWKHVARWEQQLCLRPAVGRGMAALG